MVNLQLDPDVLKPLIEAVVRETVAKLDGEGGRFNDKIAFAEPEAARLLAWRSTSFGTSVCAGGSGPRRSWASGSAT